MIPVLAICGDERSAANISVLAIKWPAGYRDMDACHRLRNYMNEHGKLMFSGKRREEK